MVLLGDSFRALSPAFTEGRRIVAGLSNAMYLFLTRVATSMLLILAIAVVGLGFPYEPAQISLTLFTVGIPSFFLTLWARPDPPPPELLGSLARFVIPAAIVTGILGVAIYTVSYEAVLNGVNSGNFPREAITVYEQYTGLPAGRGAGFARASASIEAQTMLSIFVSLTAFALILFLEPPAQMFTAWTVRSPDRRPALLVAGLLAVFLIVLTNTTLAGYFGLIVLGELQAFIQVGTLVLWFLALSAIWRARVFDRLFSLDRDGFEGRVRPPSAEGRRGARS
jgi:cation-transporting ATPase E